MLIVEPSVCSAFVTHLRRDDGSVLTIDQAEASPVMMEALEVVSATDCGLKLLKVGSNFIFSCRLHCPVAALSTDWQKVSPRC
jgi:hypothetical protein